MFRHVVLFTWVADATEEQKATVETRLKELPGAIPEIRAYDIGGDAGVNQGNYEFAVVADFDSVADYIVYRDHPAHRAVIAEAITPIVAGRVAVQYSL
ncbi:Dabb family protein [Sphaerisporangium sp. NPDC051011]|uniref:Dabb family protein n=1 Tax=Sphaerisporangium sp. NPDC051011 TaxID=3155792 RepID=UPI0033EED3A8